jgi:uncharacterized Tic20 family protein
MHDPTPDKSPAPPLDTNPFAPPTAQPPSLTAQSGLTEDERTLAMLCHLLGIFTGFLGPLILWLVKRDSSPFIGHHGRESLNFQLTLMLAMLCLGSATFVLMLVLVGILLIPVLFIVPILALIAEILAAIAAQRGEWHRYPCCIRFV